MNFQLSLTPDSTIGSDQTNSLNQLQNMCMKRHADLSQSAAGMYHTDINSELVLELFVRMTSNFMSPLQHLFSTFWDGKETRDVF